VCGDLFSVGVMLREMLTGEHPSPDHPPHLLPSDAHRGLDARHDAVVTRMAALDPRARPIDASEARAALATLPWPPTIDALPTQPLSMRKSIPPIPPNRVELAPDGALVDLWTGRRIEQIPLTERSLARARAFALADHAALQTVWRVDVAARTIWLEALDGPLDRPLTQEENARLRDALDALHAAGGVHACVDRRHIVDTPAGVALRFGADEDTGATADRDRQALAKL
jgi:hypothetical protein